MSPTTQSADPSGGARRRRRLIAGGAFALLTIAASVLVARRLTHSSWPLDHAEPFLVAAAALAYLLSLVFRARAWHRLFPADERPDQGRCLASVGAGAASGVVLPFRLDYLVKVGMLQRLGGIRVGLGAIALSIVSLGMIDAIAMLPLSISATATSNSLLRGPLLIVVAFGVGCCTLLVVSRRLTRMPALSRSRRLHALGEHVARHTTPAGEGTRSSPGVTSSHAGRHGRSAAQRCSALWDLRSLRRPLSRSSASALRLLSFRSLPAGRSSMPARLRRSCSRSESARTSPSTSRLLPGSCS